MKRLIDIILALCMGFVLHSLCFTRSLLAYSIISEIGFLVLTMVYYAFLIIYIWRCAQYRFQPLFRFMFIVPGFITAFLITGYAGILPWICAIFHVDASSNLQGLLEVLSFFGMLLVGIGISILRIWTIEYSIQRNCWRFFGNGRFQLLEDSAYGCSLYDAASKETILSDVIFYKCKGPNYLISSKSGAVVFCTKHGEISHSDSEGTLPSTIRTAFSTKRERKV